VGVGVVSFLKIKVYSSAFYADLSNPNLKVTVRFEPSLPSLLTYDQIPSSASPEEKLEYIVRNTSCVLRISESFCRASLCVIPVTNVFDAVPTRNTTYSHLRDGFVRKLQTRQRVAHQAGELSSEEQLTLQGPISQLRTALPNVPFNKGASLDLMITPPDPKQPRALILRDLGAVQSEWVARELMMSFFDGKGTSVAVCLHVSTTMVFNLIRFFSLCDPSWIGSRYYENT
jgi:hypothetical protein